MTEDKMIYWPRVQCYCGTRHYVQDVHPTSRCGCGVRLMPIVNREKDKG